MAEGHLWEITEQNQPFLFRQLELRADSLAPLTPPVSGRLKLRTRPTSNARRFPGGAGFNRAEAEGAAA